MEIVKFLYQYLKDEDLHYLVEFHEEDGIEGEHFFESEKEFLKFVEENNINYNQE